jgi:hypothetical protein
LSGLRLTNVIKMIGSTNLTDIVGATHGTAINALRPPNLVAAAASGAVLEERLIAAGRHGGEGVLVRVLEAASTT